MIELNNNRLVFSFPEIHPQARCSIGFKRTFRIPDDNKGYPLPPDLGEFPLNHVDDIGENLPSEWEKRGGVFFPMYQAEAMWIHFDADYPFAIKIAAGKINAVTGDTWNNELHDNPQDYVVIPKQPWIDGFCVAKGRVRQFVAMPLGSGYTAEEQLTNMAEHGGIQIIAYPMKFEHYRELDQSRPRFSFAESGKYFETRIVGLAPGGLMWQDIYEDIHDLSAWAKTAKSRCFVHLLNSEVYRSLTDKEPPSPVITAKRYTEYGLPWFKYYDENATAVQAQDKLAGLDSVAAKSIKKAGKTLLGNESVNPEKIHSLRVSKVREGEF